MIMANNPRQAPQAPGGSNYRSTNVPVYPSNTQEPGRAPTRQTPQGGKGEPKRSASPLTKGALKKGGK
jgi:hypothetical protein